MADYVTRDGKILRGDTAREVLLSFWTISHMNPAKTIEQFMISLIHGVKLQTGHDVRVDSCEHCLEDLVTAKLIKRTN